MAMANLNKPGKRLIILGGGLSGLSYVHYLRNFLAYFKKDQLLSKVTILEANNYMGGSVKSSIYQDGAIHEMGPRSIRTSGIRAQNTVALLEQLGLSDKVLTISSKSPAARNRYVYNNNRLYKVPMSFGKLLHKLPNSKATLASAVYSDLFKAKKMNLDDYPYKDPSIYDFFAHRFGKEISESLCDPILRGITAGDCRQLSTRALFSDLIDKEQAYGSIIKGIFKPPVTKMTHDELFPNDILESKLLDKFQKEHIMSYNLDSGLQTLPEYLSNSLLNTNDDDLLSIYNETRVESIKLSNFDQHDTEAPCSVTVRTIDGDRLKIDGDYIISSIPASELTSIMTKDSLPNVPASLNILDELKNIPHSPVGCVCVEYRGLPKSKLPKELNSFGLLTHSKANCKVLGIAFDSTMFPSLDEKNDSIRMTCMMGGSWYKEVFGTENLDSIKDAQLEQIALDEIKRILKITDEPHRMTSLLWKTGIAQYKPGHKERLTKVRSELERLSIPLFLIGQSYDGVAVNDVIFTARMAAYNFVKSNLNEEN